MNIIAYTRVSERKAASFEEGQILRSHTKQYDVICERCNVVILQVAEADESSGNKKTELSDLLANIAAGEMIYTYDFSRVAYSITELLQILKRIQKKGAILRTLKEGFDSSTDKGRIYIEAMEQLAAFEKAAFSERQKLGISKAKAEGKYENRGKQPVLSERDYNRIKYGKVTKTALAKELHISRPTLYKLLYEHDTIYFMPPNLGYIENVDDWDDE